jgi:cobalt-zinc-cadmium efflux system protein
MARAGWNLVHESGRIFLEAARANADPAVIGPRIAAIPAVAEVHDLHVWQITSGQPSLSAHILVTGDVDCHAVRTDIEAVLHDEYQLQHTTLQVDHADRCQAQDQHCVEPHGPVHRAPSPGTAVTKKPTLPTNGLI